MARLRYNGLTAELGGAIDSDDTAVTFAAALTHVGGNVPTISGTDYIPLTLLDSGGEVAEIVYLTAYTAAGTSGTVTRAREGTTGVSHASGADVVHAPTATDFTFRGVSLTKTATQAVGTAAETPVTFDAESFDTDGFHEGVTNPSRITIPTGLGGKYLIGGSATIAGLSTGHRFIVFFKKNGSILSGYNGNYSAVNPGTLGASVSALVELAVGDYIELVVYHNAGANKDVQTTASVGTTLWAEFRGY